MLTASYATPRSLEICRCCTVCALRLAWAKPLYCGLGVARSTALARLVHRREVRHFHTLGRLLRSIFRRAACKGREPLRRVVLELTRSRQKSAQWKRNISVSQPQLWRPTSLTLILRRCSERSCSTPIIGRMCSHVPARAMWHRHRSTTKASRSGAVRKPTAVGAARGTRSTSDRSATYCSSLCEAGRRQGLHMGIYYSLYEWYNPLWLSDQANATCAST